MACHSVFFSGARFMELSDSLFIAVGLTSLPSAEGTCELRTNQISSQCVAVAVGVNAARSNHRDLCRISKVGSPLLPLFDVFSFLGARFLNLLRFYRTS